MKTKSLLHSIYLICLAGILTILFLSSMKTMALIMIILLLGHSQKQNHFRFYQRRKPIRIICLLFFILTAVCFDGLMQSRYSNALYAIEPAKTNQQNIKKEASAIKIHFIDTGNSDCTFIQSQDKNVLIDGGDNDDEQRIVSYLHQLKVKKIDYLISTHPDADHCGGLDAVVTNFDISELRVLLLDTDLLPFILTHQNPEIREYAAYVLLIECLPQPNNEFLFSSDDET